MENKVLFGFLLAILGFESKNYMEGHPFYGMSIPIWCNFIFVRKKFHPQIIITFLFSKSFLLIQIRPFLSLPVRENSAVI